MENEIIVHMGIPKTGTSSLQKFLVKNNHVLMENGYCYPNFRKNDFTDASIRGAWRWGNGVMQAFRQGKLDSFNKLMEDSLSRYHVILSDECVWWNVSGYDFIRYLKERYQSVRLIVYLRRQDMSLESGYAEHVSNIVFGKHCTENIEEFRKSIMQGGWAQQHLYYEKLKKWESLVGRECMAVYTYEEAKEYGLFRHFTDCLGLDYAQFQETKSTNITLSVMDIEIKRRLNHRFQDKAGGALFVMDEVYSNSNLRFEGPKGHLLSPGNRQEILKFFAEDNQRTAEEYFHRKDLFPDKVDYPQVILNEAEVEKNYVETLEQLIVHMVYENKYPMLRKALNQGKKVVLFGAGFMGKRAITDFRIPAELIIDNDKKKVGKRIGGIPVVWAGDVTEWDRYVILTTPLDSSAIEDQLQRLGLVKGVHFMNIHTMGLW